jgi:hypothetical protein
MTKATVGLPLVAGAVEGVELDVAESEFPHPATAIIQSARQIRTDHAVLEPWEIAEPSGASDELLLRYMNFPLSALTGQLD